MKISLKSQRKEFKNSDHCIAYEYPLDEKAINGCVIKLYGRYPEKGSARNEISKEMGYIIKGSGKVTVNCREAALAEGDIVLIEPGETYFWEGDMEIFMPCTPAWSPEQHKFIE